MFSSLRKMTYPISSSASRFSSIRLHAKLEETILSKLQKIVDPLHNNKSIRKLGYLKAVTPPLKIEGGESLPTTVHIEIPSPFHPFAKEIVDGARGAVRRGRGGVPFPRSYVMECRIRTSSRPCRTKMHTSGLLVNLPH